MIIALVRPYIGAILMIAAGALLRVWPLQSLEWRAPWITFYPMIMLAALSGGIFVGLFSSLLTIAVIVFGWPLLTDRPYLMESADWLGLGVFFLNCVLMSAVGEATRRSRRKALEAKEQADLANKAKSVFLANMSHELRTPLNAVIGFSRQLRNSSELSPDQAAGLDIIARSGEHLLNLINNILDISKIESGRVMLEEGATDLPYLLREVASLMSLAAGKKALGFSLETSPDLPRYIVIDSGKLRQVLINLIGNAIKFTDLGRVGIRARAIGQAGEPGCRLRFEIEDTGPGLRPEDQERVFLPFVQAELLNTTERGTGLGLAISKQDVELMGGTIGVSSERGKGSTFYFELPARLAEAGAVASIPPSRRVVGLADGQGARRVLIAEDQDDNRVLLRKILEPLGFELREAYDGREAVEIFGAWGPDLIFMDIRMPVMDGIEATKRIRARPLGERAKIVALTAHALEEERSEILAAGCDAVILKPYKENELYAAIEKHLGLRFKYAAPAAPGAEELGLLPADLVRDLGAAVEILDERACLEAIDRVQALDPGLGERLRGLVKELRYEELLATLDRAAERDVT